MLESISELLSLSQENQRFIFELIVRVILFVLGTIVSPLFGRTLPFCCWWILKLVQIFVPIKITVIYDRIIKPAKNALVTVGALAFIALCLYLLDKYTIIYQFLGFFVYLALAISIVWLASRIAKRVIRIYGIKLVQRWGGEVNETALVFETLVNIVIILFAILLFARGLRLNLIAISASIGVGGVVVAFGARHALERIIGTMELFLDRPYQPGEYIQVNFNPYAEDVYGRVESIGLRSTKIRTAGRNTIIIVPNSVMASKNIENISRGKKVVAMLYLDFSRCLGESEEALVRRITIESTDTFWGIDKANTRISFSQPDQKLGTRARINFFLTSSGEDSLSLRKRLVDLANEAIANKLIAYDIRFSMPEPIVYVDSPMTI